MNAKTRTPAEQAKLDKRAKAARDKRADAKVAKLIAANTTEAPAAEATREIILDGETYTVAASMSEAEGMKVAQLLHASVQARKNGTPDGAEDADVAKPPKPVKLKGDPLATVFYRLSKTAMEALSGKPGAEYRAANPKDWKILKASKRITGGQSFAFTGNLRPESAATLAAALRSIAASEGFAKPGSLITNAAKLESNHYVTKAAAKR